MESDESTGRNRTGGSVGRKSQRSVLVSLLVFMIQLCRHIVYWMLIIFEVVSNPHLGSGYQSGEAEQIETPRRADDRFGRGIFRRTILIIAGKTREDYNTHCASTLSTANCALAYVRTAKEHTAVLVGVIRQTYFGGESSGAQRDGNENLPDPQIVAFWVRVVTRLKTMYCTGLWIRDPLPTTITMRVKGAKGETQHAAGLDSGAHENLISEAKVVELGVRMVPYDGDDLKPIGKSVRPIGWVRIQYCVSNIESDWYEAKFAVLESGLCKGFNILLSAEEIEKRSFLVGNRAVLFVQTQS